ncbi:MAG: hypothetical protein ACJA09_002375 [Alcanivorax sp.]|jgi:hypothetical protein
MTLLVKAETINGLIGFYDPLADPQLKRQSIALQKAFHRLTGPIFRPKNLCWW